MPDDCDDYPYYYNNVSVGNFLTKYQEEIDRTPSDERYHTFHIRIDDEIEKVEAGKTPNDGVCQITFDAAFARGDTTAQLKRSFSIKGKKTAQLKRGFSIKGGNRHKKNKRTRSKRRTTRANKKRQSRNRRK